MSYGYVEAKVDLEQMRRRTTSQRTRVRILALEKLLKETLDRGDYPDAPEGKKYVCTTCGSSDVYSDAYVGLNDNSNFLTYQQEFCAHCDGECSTTEVDRDTSEPEDPEECEHEYVTSNRPDIVQGEWCHKCGSIKGKDKG